MEPVHGGRDDLHLIGHVPYWRQPQWSPSTEDGTTQGEGVRHLAARRAAMEPVHGGRDDIHSTVSLPSPIWPQWSPSTEDGTTDGQSGPR